MKPDPLDLNATVPVAIESFLAALAVRLGRRLTTAREGSTRRPLVWRTPVRSLGHLAPDFLRPHEYPEPAFAFAELTAGERHVRLGLASLPFGFEGPAEREETFRQWEQGLRAPVG